MTGFFVLLTSLLAKNTPFKNPNKNSLPLSPLFLTRCVFHHLRETEKQGIPEVNGPGLVTFDPKEKKRFLLFLRRESAGRYCSLTGQTDPVGGVKDLGTYP